MSKLRSLGRPTPEELIERDSMHVCRWCRYCVHEDNIAKCVKGSITSLADTNIMHDLIEEGRVSEAVDEALHSCPTGEDEFLKNVVDAVYSAVPKLSVKKRKDIENAFNSALEQYLDMRLKAEVVEAMETLLCNYEVNLNRAADDGAGVQICDPSTHYCRDFW